MTVGRTYPARQSKRRSHCQRGHAMVEPNVQVNTRADGRLLRKCKICAAMKSAERRARQPQLPRREGRPIAQTIEDYQDLSARGLGLVAIAERLNTKPADLAASLRRGGLDIRFDMLTHQYIDGGVIAEVSFRSWTSKNRMVEAYRSEVVPGQPFDAVDLASLFSVATKHFIWTLRSTGIILRRIRGSNDWYQEVLDA